ncbi:MAG: hypothetical protein M3P16_02880 [Chloroflexota bacterium]|nr:hypothetical protein [Chloroflexota bacterium]
MTGYPAQFCVVEDDANVRTLRELGRGVGPFEEAGIADDFVLTEARWSDTPAPEPALT